ncbi:dTDP-4-keto-6-deoxy-D-glucose epimerase [Streptomonospora sp. PA3]|nr:dTDP-4-keto-6-deoxy-D-glucose epimerase [Streptomonospora sp. PA3]
MTAEELRVEGAFAFTPQVFPDDRGYFLAPFQEPAFTEVLGHGLFQVAQANHSRSRRGVVRGVHYTVAPPGSAKYVHCMRGRSLDIVVDIRVGSPTYGRWDAVLLDQADFRAVYLPLGVGHAFIALEDDTVMSYFISSSYVPEYELAVDAFDPALGLPVPEDITPIRSPRDTVAPKLAEAREQNRLPHYTECKRLEADLYAGSGS